MLAAAPAWSQSGRRAATSLVPGLVRWMLAAAPAWSQSGRRAATSVIPGLVLWMLAAAPAWPQVLINTFAGGTIRSGVPAQSAAFQPISGMALDASGRVVVCERESNVIRRIGTDGIVETIAGNGTTGYGGDGGPALQAVLDQPSYPRFDGSGNLYFFDAASNRIRRIDTSGAIATVAGDGVGLVPGMDVEGPALYRPVRARGMAVAGDGTIYFSEGSSVMRLTASGAIVTIAGVAHPDCVTCSSGDGGPATAAEIAGASLLALDGQGNLYVVEGGFIAPFTNIPPVRIREISPAGTITAYAGYGAASSAPSPDGTPALNAAFQEILDLTSDPAGNLYYVELENNNGTLRRIDTNGILSTLPAGSRVTPAVVGMDPNGNVAFAGAIDSGLDSPQYDGVARVTAQGAVVVGGGNLEPAPDGMPAGDAWFLYPERIALDRAGAVYVSEANRCVIRKIGGNGLLSTVAGTGTCGTAATGQPSTTQDLPVPDQILVDSQGDIYFTDSFGNAYEIAPGGKVTPLAWPVDLYSTLAIDAKDRIYIEDLTSLTRISPGGQPQTLVQLPAQPAGVSGLRSLQGLARDPAGNVYFEAAVVLSTIGFQLFRVNDDGTVSLVSGLLFGNAGVSLLDSSGGFWDVSGGQPATFGAGGYASVGREEKGYSGDGGPAQSARFNISPPGAVAVAPNGDFYLLESTRIRRMTGMGTTPPPAIAAGGIVNAVSYTGGGIAPGELVSIFGSNFGATAVQTYVPENNSVPTVLGRVKVLFGNFDGAITAVTPNQINVFVPYEVSGSNISGQPLQVQVDGAVSAAVTVPVVAAAPGLATADQSGAGQGAILNQDSTVNSDANPAARGSIVSFFGTGEGLISPALSLGEFTISTPYSTPAQPVTVTIGGLPAQVTYAGEAPFLPAGVLQINARIPNGVSAGDVPVAVAVGTIGTAKSVTVAVK